ncbi:DUF732 domain-containing protein [[Mycobacterium] nativiensis]|uniref:DUF732 domain-containing protein n=1 Tax=[Mycobacterium] nativiensis TaxID=2855503 RepID=A0ABU5XU70_9MYCO|nr:DUF732 domain-containing protein [Mycolicibacter sp. MYC340]MEB3031534.1 DUF732 domain-containing protein [Mycolicibacter sp. MYC340]
MIALSAVLPSGEGQGLTIPGEHAPGPVPFSVVAAVVLLGLVAAPSAHADVIDTNFLSALNARGIDFVSGQSAVVAGHEVCDELDMGRPKNDVVSDVMNSSELDGYHAGFFVGVSVSAFCPRHHG